MLKGVIICYTLASSGSVAKIGEKSLEEKSPCSAQLRRPFQRGER
jgi:hypothetical protein